MLSNMFECVTIPNIFIILIVPISAETTYNIGTLSWHNNFKKIIVPLQAQLTKQPTKIIITLQLHKKGLGLKRVVVLRLL